MRSFISACVVAIVIAVGAVFVLNSVQEPVAEAFSSPTTVRL
jgi:hypothetical protein